MNAWGPWLLIVGGPLAGLLWFQFRSSSGAIEWDFQKTGNAIQLEWVLEKRGVPLKFYTPGFIFGGKNGDTPLYQIQAHVTTDRDKRKFPLFIAVEGQWVQFSQTEGIPAGARTQIGCQMREDTPLHCEAFPQRISPEQFLNDIGGFTFTFAHDGEKPEHWHFSSAALRQQFDRQKQEAYEKIRTDPVLQPTVTKKPQAEEQRSPTLEATNNSKINAAGATFSGELKNQFARADNNSEVQMSGAVVVTNDGMTSVTPGAAVIPAPTGEYKWLSSTELKQKIREISSDLRQMQLGFDADYAKLQAEGPSEEKLVLLYGKYSEPYKQRFSKDVLELAAEMFSRNPKPFSTPVNLLPGRMAVLYGRFGGQNHDLDVTKFLEALAAHMDAKG